MSRHGECATNCRISYVLQQTSSQPFHPGFLNTGGRLAGGEGGGASSMTTSHFTKRGETQFYAFLLTFQQISVASSVVAWTTNCVFGLSRNWQKASRVAFSVSVERDSHRVPPLERVMSLAVPQLVPPPEARHHQKQNCQLSHMDDGSFPLQPMMVVPSLLSAQASSGLEGALTPSPLRACSGAPELEGTRLLLIAPQHVSSW